jgi:hypothetical protein
VDETIDLPKGKEHVEVRSRKTLFLLGLAGLIAALAVAGTALAQTPTPTPNQPKSNYRDTFLDKLATALGTTKDKLNGAFTQARNDTIDQAVNDGKLTQQQADKMKARQNAGPGFSFRGLPEGKAKPRITMGMNSSQIRDAIAGALGMKPEDLAAQLKAGKSLSELAQGKEQAVKDAVLKVVKDRLDQAVKAGKLTQAQADQSYSKAQKMDPLKMFGGPWGKMHGERKPNEQNGLKNNSRPSREPAASAAGTL